MRVSLLSIRLLTAVPSPLPPPCKVEVHLGTIVDDVFGTTEGDIPDGGSPLTGALVRNDAGEKEVPLRGLFYAIGHRPNTGLFGVSFVGRTRSRVSCIVYRGGGLWGLLDPFFTPACRMFSSVR